jgi:GNAT superfamily N-acetyltransferase
MQQWSDHIRGARPDDAPALADLSTQLGYPSTEAQVRERLRLLEDPERELLVAVAADGLAGFIDVPVLRVVESDPYGEVGGLVVGAPHRGAGLGAALLAAAADWSRVRGLERLWIRANLARVNPHEFYAAVGCRTVKDQRVYEYPL